MDQTGEWSDARPHPNPLPQERESAAGVSDLSDVRSSNPAPDCSERRRTFLPLPGGVVPSRGSARGEGKRSNKPNPLSCIWCISWLLFFFSAPLATAQSNPPPASYVRSYVNDIPNQPLVTVSVYGASNVSCLTIEEDLPGPASVLDISGDGVLLPAQNVIRWGPYFNTVATNVSYRLTGLPSSYPVNGGAWMNGQWYFSPGATLITVLPPGGGGIGVPTAPPQVAVPAFTPISGASVPMNVIISCPTAGAAIYYTLDGTLPTTSSLLYTDAIFVASASTIRAVAFTNGWMPSVAAMAYYGPPAVPANVQVSRSISTNSPTTPVVTFNVVPGTNACITLTETLPLGLSASNITAGGNYVASNNVVLWGPFFGTNAQTLSYQAVGLAGTYAVQATWSVNGVGGGEATTTNLVVAPLAGNGAFTVPSQPQQVAAPVFSPASGSNVPASVAIFCATPGAAIYYTLDGSLPTTSSQPYTRPVYLASASTLRAVAFTNGWRPSVLSVAYYGPPAAPANVQVARSVNTSSPTAPVVTFSVTPGTGAQCVAVAENLSAGLGAINISSGGDYIASKNSVVWGPFLGTNTQILSYQAVGLQGTYPVQAAWSVDGVGGSEAVGTTLVIASTGNGFGVPTAPPQESVPILSPVMASNLPVSVSISSSDPQAQIYYTTDGTLPTQSSPLYAGTLTINTRTTLRAVEFRPGYLPSVSAVGDYVPVSATITVPAAQSVSGSGSFLPTVSLTATPQGTGTCYAVVEPIPSGLTPSGMSADAIWDSTAGVIRWGPYLDNQSRLLSFNVSGQSGTYPLSGQVSVNGYSVGASGDSSVQINANYIGSPPVTNLAACATDYLSYSVDINPAPGFVTVTSASGTVSWGDGTQTTISQPLMTLEKSYTVAGTYSIVVAADWTGYSSTGPVSGHATKTDSVQVVTTCQAPQIVTQPSNQVVLAGSTAQFTVSASSSVPMTYQWYLDTSAQFFSPSDFATLTLLNTGSQLAGLYSVIITNAFGSVTSSVASLTVVTPLVTGAVRNYDGSVSLNFAGLPNSTSQVWATTNLIPPVIWQSIFTNTSTAADGTWQFIDTNTVGTPAKFYRFSTP